MKFIINLTLYALFTSLFLFDGFLSDGLKNLGLHIFPHKLSYITELLSGIIAVILFITYALRKRFSIRIAYLFFFFLFVMHALVGIIINSVPSGAIFAALRRYFSYMPLFFLPMTYEFSDQEIKSQLIFLLFFAVIQCPVSIYQRFFKYSNYITGDFVTGTLLTSSILSIYLICCITALTVFFMRNKIKLPLYLALLIILFFPTTINETKGTIVLFPIAIIMVILFSSGKILSLKKVALITTGGALLILVFIPLYGYLYPQMDIVNFFMGQGEKTNSIQGYLYKGVAENELGEKEPGRIDVLSYPFKILSKDPFKLIIGLGMGNVNPSGIEMLSGEYTKYHKYLPETLTASSLIWETGLIGLFLHALFFWLLFRDASALRSDDDITGNLALAWIGIIAILWMSFFYKSIFHQKIIVYLFYYLSGLIAAKRANIGQSQSAAK